MSGDGPHSTANNSFRVDSAVRPSKRNRITIACASCRRRKSRCDGARPRCSTCRNNGYDCAYSNTTSLSKASASKEYINTLESRLAALESSVVGLSRKVVHLEEARANDCTLPIETSPLTSELPAHPPSSEDGDLGMADTQDPTDGIGSIVFTKEENSGFFGPSSNIAFTRQIVQTSTTILTISALGTSSVSSGSETALHSHMLHVSRPPSPTRFQVKSSGSPSFGTEPFIVPPETEAMKMIETYFATTGALFPYIDRDAFLDTYHYLVSTNIRKVRRSWLGLLNMVFVMSISASNSDSLSASDRAFKANVFHQRAFSLCQEQFHRGASVEIVQLLLLMSQYLQGTEHSIETWNVHGLAVKAAYQLGLHSPNALSQYSPLEREVRKRTWFACVVLDRTLSMTLGRPCAIPENFVKLELPSVLETISAEDSSADRAFATVPSINFFNATITLYRIMGEAVDTLYGSNIGGAVPDNVFEIASHLLRFEQKLQVWHLALPEGLSLVSPNDLDAGDERKGTLRFRVILTLRYLNVRVLVHRPILEKFLELLGTSHINQQQLVALRQLGTNSMAICTESALHIITLMLQSLQFQSSDQHLLGAWWFSLYYAFNAALVIYSALLVQHQAALHGQPLTPETTGLSVDALQQAIKCLSSISQNNRMAEKCVRYMSSLAHILNLIYYPQDSQENVHNMMVNDVNVQGEIVQHVTRPHDILDMFDANDLHVAIGLDDIWGPIGVNFGLPSTQTI